MRLVPLFPLILAALILAACVAVPRADGPVGTSAPDPAARLAAECALLAEARLRDASLHPGVTEGCPGSTARDTRPLPEQMTSLRAAQGAALPAGVAPGTRGDTVFRRMITRGVAPPLAAALTGDPRFAIAAR